MDAQPDWPEVTGAHSFNELALRRGWAVRCDVGCRFMFGKLNDLHALWRSKAAPSGIPPRSEMTARLLKPYLTMLAFHERVPGPDGTRRYRVRLMGEDATNIAGAASGKFYDEFLPAKSVPIWNAMTDAVLGHGAPVRILIRADEVNKPFLAGEIFNAPLLADDGSASLVLTASHFESNFRFEDVVAEVEERRPLAVEPAM